MVNSCPIFEVSSISRSRDISRGAKILKRHVTLTMPLSEMSFHRQGETCYGLSIYQIWSFYRCTRYEAMNGGVVQNAENGVVWGGQGALRVMGNDTIR